MIARSAIVAETRRWIGTPYRHQGRLRGVGVDCLGLVVGVWESLAGDPPEAVRPYTSDWAEAAGEESMIDAARRHLVPVDCARPGDVLLFRWRPGQPAKHAAILVEGSLWLPPEPRASLPAARIVHAYDGARWVAESGLHLAWRSRLAGAFAFPFAERA